MAQRDPLGTRRWAAKKPKLVAQTVGSVGQVTRGAWAISQSQPADDPQLHLLFAKGKRPGRSAIRAFAVRQRSVGLSHDLRSADPDSEATGSAPPPIFAELLCDGLTFDLAGLTPGPSSPFPQVAHRFDLPELPLEAGHEALAIRPGPHLLAGARSMPVVRAMLALARDLVLCFDDCLAVVWGPSGSAIGRRFFESVVSAWLDGGPFPALGLTAFTPTADGALESVGLEFWIGQELRIEPPLSQDRVAATRLGIRLVNQLVLAGRLTTNDRIIAPDGSPLLLRPARDRAVISVWRE